MRIFILLILSTLINLNLFGQNLLPFKKKNQTWCFVDTSLNSINKKLYKEIVPMRIHYFMIKKRNKYALANNLGKRLTRFKYDNISYSANSFLERKPVVAFLAYIGKKEFVINKYGNEIKNTYTLAICGGGRLGIYCALKPYHKVDKIGFINFSVNMISGDTISALFDDFKYCKQREVFVRKDGYWGVINECGDYVIKPIYQDIRVKINDYSEFIGVFVKIDDKWGWLNRYYKMIVQPKYKEMSDFKLGYSHVVTPENQTGLVTESGIELFER